MNGAECEIRVYDKDFNWINAAMLAESVQFSRELYGAGRFEISINPDKKGAMDLCRPGNIIVINGDGNKSGVVTGFSAEDSRNGPVLNITGVTGNGFAERRITVPPTASQDSNALGWDKTEGPAETVIKHYAGMNLINAYDGQRNIPNMIMAPDLGRGIVFPWKSRYQKLSEELYNMGIYAEMGHVIYADVENRRWVFDIIEGFTRTQSGLRNPDGLTKDPVLFNMGRQNLSYYKYTEDYSNHRTTGYAGGQGEDENRLIYILNPEAEGWERKEEFLDCGNAVNITELIYYGQQKLNEFKEVKAVEADALPKVFIFEKDFFLGDKVTLFIDRLGIELDIRVTAVKEIWERQIGYNAEIRFGGNLPNLFTVFGKKNEIR